MNRTFYQTCCAAPKLLWPTLGLWLFNFYFLGLWTVPILFFLLILLCICSFDEGPSAFIPAAFTFAVLGFLLLGASLL